MRTLRSQKMKRLTKGCPVSETVIPRPELWSFASYCMLLLLGQTHYVAAGQPECEKINVNALEKGTEDRETKRKKDRNITPKTMIFLLGFLS